MIRNVNCLGLSYDEVEDIVQEYRDNYAAQYQGGIVQVVNNDNDNDVVDFAQVLNKVHSEWNISPNALTIYLDFGYIYPRTGAEVIVIDGIQEE